MIDEAAIGERFRALAGELDERRRRLWAAAEARVAGRGGIAAVVRATGMAENTIRRGLQELEAGERLETGRVRRSGGGRKALTAVDPTLLTDLERLVDAESRGDPESPLRWTTKSVRRVRDELREQGHPVSHETVAQLLRDLGYSLQANRKTREGSSHPDRDAQFEHINRTVETALAAGEPVISVDTKTKELVGDVKNGGREWHPIGSPVPLLHEQSYLSGPIRGETGSCRLVRSLSTRRVIIAQRTGILHVDDRSLTAERLVDVGCTTLWPERADLTDKQAERVSYPFDGYITQPCLERLASGRCPKLDGVQPAEGYVGCTRSARAPIAGASALHASSRIGLPRRIATPTPHRGGTTWAEFRSFRQARCAGITNQGIQSRNLPKPGGGKNGRVLCASVPYFVHAVSSDRNMQCVAVLLG